MAAEVIDRLSTTLDVRIHAFAMCEIETGWRLAFDPMNAATIHYVLAGSGAVRIGDGVDVPYGPCSIIVVPPGVPQSLGESGDVLGEASAADNCGLIADGLVKFTAGQSGGPTLVVCATITAAYNGALGLFDQLRFPAAADTSQSETFRTA